MLTVPAGLRGAGVIALVLGGLGSRLDLPVDRIDELALAAATVAPAVDGDGSSSRRTSWTTGSWSGSARSRTAPGRTMRCAASSTRSSTGSPGSGRRTASGSSSRSSAVGRDDDRGRPPSPHRPPRGVPHDWRPRRARPARRGADAARPLARAPLRGPRRADRGPRPGRCDRADQGDRPLRRSNVGSSSRPTPCRRSSARSGATSATARGASTCRAG